MNSELIFTIFPQFASKADSILITVRITDNHFTHISSFIQSEIKSSRSKNIAFNLSFNSKLIDYKSELDFRIRSNQNGKITSGYLDSAQKDSAWFDPELKQILFSNKLKEELIPAFHFRNNPHYWSQTLAPLTTKYCHGKISLSDLINEYIYILEKNFKVFESENTRIYSKSYQSKKNIAK